MANITTAGLQNLKNKTKQKFGNLLPDELLDIYVSAFVESGNDRQQAITAVRTSNAYQSFYPGNLNPDGVTTKYTESEYSQLIDGYKRKFEALGINADVILTDERKKQLVDNITSPDELGTRINNVYTNILSGIPEVKEFYQRNFNRTLTDAEIIASAIDPKIGEGIISGTISAKDIVSQNVIRAQIGGQALLAGTEISVEAVEALRQQGIDPGAARQAFNQVQNIQQAALAQGRDIPDVQDIVEGLQLGDMEDLTNISNILRQQSSQSSAAAGSRQTQQGQVTGLIEQ
tara:strand:- start:855 stop:1721 length:867 start_codon:yes stop_codon:yes gene_type:complete